MPTETEWEYAARCGKESKSFKYRGSNTINDVAWYDNPNIGKTDKVKGIVANKLDIYDMNGNAFEWSQDWVVIIVVVYRPILRDLNLVLGACFVAAPPPTSATTSWGCALCFSVTM